MQQLTTKLEGLELQVAAVHPKVAMEAQKLQNLAQLAMLERGGGRTIGWRKEEEQAEAHRVRTTKQLKRKLKIQPEAGNGSGWR